MVAGKWEHVVEGTREGVGACTHLGGPCMGTSFIGYGGVGSIRDLEEEPTTTTSRTIECYNVWGD